MLSIPEEILESILRDVPLYENYLKKVGTAVLAEGISKHPIFVAHRETEIALGRPIVISEMMQSQWSINASVLEEFINKKLINNVKLAHFKSVYKDPKTHACLFVVSGSEGGFAFYPYRDAIVPKEQLN